MRSYPRNRMTSELCLSPLFALEMFSFSVSYSKGSIFRMIASASLFGPASWTQIFIYTHMHLWRITAPNAVHRCKVAKMLKAPPHHFRARAVAPTAPHKPAELGDPGDRLAQRRRLSRWRGDPMDGTIQRLPFVGLQEDATRRIRNRTCQHGGVKNPPCQDTVERQSTA